jgi:hypothetical protein
MMVVNRAPAIAWVFRGAWLVASGERAAMLRARQREKMADKKVVMQETSVPND